jgi:hypothetical protein
MLFLLTNLEGHALQWASCVLTNYKKLPSYKKIMAALKQKFSLQSKNQKPWKN